MSILNEDIISWLREIDRCIALSFQINPSELHGSPLSGDDAEESFLEADDFSDE